VLLAGNISHACVDLSNQSCYTKPIESSRVAIKSFVLFNESLPFSPQRWTCSELWFFWITMSGRRLCFEQIRLRNRWSQTWRGKKLIYCLMCHIHLDIFTHLHSLFYRKRMKVITRDITTTILPQAEELIAKNSGISHDQLCEILLRHQFVSFSFSFDCYSYPLITDHYRDES
jgi:hypothetical protein